MKCWTEFHYSIFDVLARATRDGAQPTQLSCVTNSFLFQEFAEGPEKEAEFLDCIDDMVRGKYISWGAGAFGEMAFAPWIRVREAGRELMKRRAAERAAAKRKAQRKAADTE